MCGFRILCPNIIFYRRLFSDINFIYYNFFTQIFFDQEIYYPKMSLDQKYCCPKNFMKHFLTNLLIRAQLLITFMQPHQLIYDSAFSDNRPYPHL